jgi:hypothetical protein
MHLQQFREFAAKTSPALPDFLGTGLERGDTAAVATGGGVTRPVVDVPGCRKLQRRVVTAERAWAVGWAWLLA